MFSHDNNIDKSLKDIKRNIDENLDKNKKYNFSKDTSMSYNDIDKIFPIYNREKACCAFIEWDDIIQYTTLGFLDYLYDEVFGYSQEDSRRIYAHDLFLERNNEYLDGMRFIENIIQSKISYEKLVLLFKKKYIESVYRSPMSPFLYSFYNSQHIMNKVIFSFKGDLKAQYFSCLRDEIAEKIFGNGADIEFIHADLSEEDILKMYNPKIFFVRNTSDMLQTAIRLKHDNKEFYVNEFHNNFSLNFIKLLSSDRVNCNFIHDTHRLYFFRDKIYAYNNR